MSRFAATTTSDQYNGGCNSQPPVFTQIPCDDEGGGVTICAEYGGFLYFGLSYRDTDWYQIKLDRSRRHFLVRDGRARYVDRNHRRERGLPGALRSMITRLLVPARKRA